MKRALLWSLAALMAILLSLVISFPAAWLAPLIERKTGGRFTLADAQGTLWSGSAYLGVIANPAMATATVFPGRFEWTLSRWIVLGEVNARITNPQLLEHVLTVIGDWRTWHVNQLMLRLPASQLAMFGAPLNTLKPSGQMCVLAQALIVRSLPEGIEIHGAMQLQLNEIASVLSPVKPLGNYRVEFEWQGKRAQLTLTTLSGPLQLEGNGALANGRIRFSGQAWALPEQESRLAILLNLLGRRHQVGNRNVFAIEFT